MSTATSSRPVVSSSTPTRAHRRLAVGAAAAMFVSAAGIVVQIASGVDYPTVPPGPIALVVTGGVLLAVRRRWAGWLAVAVSVFLTVGGALAPTGRDNVVHPENAGTFAGTVVQFAAVVVALVASAVLVVRQRRSA